MSQLWREGTVTISDSQGPRWSQGPASELTEFQSNSALETDSLRVGQVEGGFARTCPRQPAVQAPLGSSVTTWSPVCPSSFWWWSCPPPGAPCSEGPPPCGPGREHQGAPPSAAPSQRGRQKGPVFAPVLCHRDICPCYHEVVSRPLPSPVSCPGLQVPPSDSCLWWPGFPSPPSTQGLVISWVSPRGSGRPPRKPG